MPQSMVKAAVDFQEYVRSSELEPYDLESHMGVWRHLMVRTSCGKGEGVMLILEISAKHLNPDELEKVKSDIKLKFSEKTEITSFYVKLMESHGQRDRNLPELLFGEETITEELLGLKFKISPEAFFQINVAATEILYGAIGSLLSALQAESGDSSSTTVLDVCCGTGTIGLSLLATSACAQVLGIEMTPSAVTNATANATLNNLSNASFFCGRAEDIIDAVIAQAEHKNIVAIVDPPRGGLHQRVLTTLRKCEKIRKIIYVSCDARAATRNFVDLGRKPSKSYKGDPFIPKEMVGVDLFPHTGHFEVVVVMER